VRRPATDRQLVALRLPARYAWAMRLTLRRVALATATTLLSINIPTGFPLLSLWVGAQFAGHSGLSMTAVLIVIITLTLLATASVKALSWLSARYDALTDQPSVARQAAPWLRSMRAERVERSNTGGRTNTVDRIVVATVVAAVLSFEIWFFFFAGSSLPKGA
jgi:hypothetical protein